MEDENKEPTLLTKFMAIHYLAPFGNGGRGTKIHLWPFAMIVAVSIAAPIINKFLIG